MTEKFSLFMPIEIEKSGATGEDRYANMRFKGIASTAQIDSDGEILDPSGFDLKDFLSTGLFNFNHLAKKAPLTVIGEPTDAKITKSNELYVEGRLWPHSQVARDVYDLTDIMEKDSKTRKMGMSIEGVPLEKKGNRITKAKITNIAIAPSPKNKGTRVELIKGGFNDIDFETDDNGYLVDVVENGIRYRVNGNLEIIKGEVDDKLSKAIVAGTTTGTDTTDKLTTGESVKKESIEGDEEEENEDNKIKKTMSKADVFAQLLSEGYDKDSCEYLWELALEINDVSPIQKFL